MYMVLLTMHELMTPVSLCLSVSQSLSLSRTVRFTYRKTEHMKYQGHIFFYPGNYVQPIVLLAFEYNYQKVPYFAIIGDSVVKCSPPKRAARFRVIYFK